MGAEQLYNDDFVDAARRFYFDIFTSDETVEPVMLGDRVRQYFPDLANSDPEATKRRLRILGSDFFRIVGVKQPTHIVTYQRAIDSFIDSEKTRQALLDESTGLMRP